MHKWTPEQIDWIRQNIVGRFRKDCWKDFCEKYEAVSYSAFLHIISDNHIKSGVDTKLKPGHRRRWTCIGARCKSHGYTCLKIDDDTWVLEHRYIYEQAYGIKLKQSEVILFLDCNKNNLAIDNLYKTTRGILKIMQSHYPFVPSRPDINLVKIHLAELCYYRCKQERRCGLK